MFFFFINIFLFTNWNFRNVKNVSALRIGTGRAFHKAGLDVEKALEPVLVLNYKYSGHVPKSLPDLGRTKVKCKR